MTFLNSLLGRKDEPAEPAQSKAGIPTNVQNKVAEASKGEVGPISNEGTTVTTQESELSKTKDVADSFKGQQKPEPKKFAAMTTIGQGADTNPESETFTGNVNATTGNKVKTAGSEHDADVTKEDAVGDTTAEVEESHGVAKEDQSNKDEGDIFNKSNIESEEEATEVEEEAKKNGVNPDASPEEAKGAVKSVIDSLNNLGIKYKNGSLSFPKLDTGKMGAISSALTALSVAAAIMTGGAIPPMNFKKLLVHEKKEDKYIKAYDTLMTRISDAAGTDLTKSREAEIGEDTRKEMGKAGEQIAGTEYKDELSTNSALQLVKAQTDNAIRAAKANHMNQKDLASHIFNQDVRRGAEQLKVIKNEYPELYNDKKFLKEYATLVGAQNGITPNRMNAMTAQEWANVTKTGVDTAADIVDAFIPG